MSICSNILSLRKKKKLTQEQLGRLLGVTNQAVSEWESGQTLPDVMLLPKIAEVLGVTLSQLYGLEKEKTAAHRSDADFFPGEVFRSIQEQFFLASGCRFTPGGQSEEEQLRYWLEKVDNGCRLGCVSNIGGAVILTDGFAFVDEIYKNASETFHSFHGASILKTLSDPNVGKVLDYGYTVGFKRAKESSVEFTLEEIAIGCAISENDASEALLLLASLKIVNAYRNRDGKECYSFSVIKLLYAFEIYRLAQMLFDDEVWLVVRDSSMIEDYAFSEKLPLQE